MKKLKSLALVLSMAVGSAIMLNSCTADLCKDVVCQNGGTCVSGICDCVAGYEGTNCETEMRTKFLGTYAYSEVCNTGSDSYTITVNTSSTGPDQISIVNLYNAGLTTTASVDGTSLTIPSQALGAGTISGSGTISGNTINLTVTVTLGAATDTCSGSGTK